jgi:Icc-related predicted phosphoesterase
MDTAYISAVSALAGSVIGGLTTGFTTLLSQRSQARAGMVAHELSRREDLIKDFIVAASTIYGDAIVNSEPKMPEMRVLNMPKSVICADNVMRSILDTYFSPNRTIADLRELVKTGGGVDPLKEFSEAARVELRAFAPL